MNKKAKVEILKDGQPDASHIGGIIRKDLGYRTIDSRDVLGSANEVVILHQGAAYRLRVTRAGKLILNK